jgi:hypothetical protein
VFFGKVSIRGNRNVAPNSTNFDLGVRLSGIFSEALVDDCAYKGMLTFPGGKPYSILDEATISRREGRQLCMGLNAPTTGIWKTGEKWYNYAPTRLRAIHDWTYDGATWRPNCGMSYGSTPERPSLTPEDFGFPYYDIDRKLVIIWSASGFIEAPA